MAADTAVPPGIPEEDQFRLQLEQGFPWLRFASKLEDQFQEDTRRMHGLRLLLCTVIGMFSLWINVINDGKVLPDMSERLLPIWVAVTLSALVVMGGTWMIPRQRARAWHMELASCLLPLLILSVLMWSADASAHVTAKVHSANVILIVMWSCLLARQRFWFATVISLIGCLGYAFWMQGHDDLSQRIISSNLRVLSLVTVFSLGANYVLEYRERRSYLLRALERIQNLALAQASERLSQLSLQDPLTGIHNRRFFEQTSVSMWHEAEQGRKSLSLLVLDVDEFKRYNDGHGHLAGDDALKRVAEILDQVAKAHGGQAARIGGEEFALLLPGRGLAEAQQAGQALCGAIRSAAIVHDHSTVAPVLTVSIGIACHAPDQGAPAGAGIRALMALADQALYQAKADGRDRVVCQAAIENDSLKNGVEPGSAMPVSNQASLHAAVADTRRDRHVDDEGDAAEAQTQAIRALLARGWRLTRFPAWLESLYERQRANSRRWQIFGASVVGMVIYNVYLLVNRDMTPDVSDWFILPQSVVSFVTLVAGVMVLRPMPPNRREVILAAVVGLVVSSGLLLFGMSRAPTVYAGYIALILIPMFAVVGVGLSFRLSTGVALAAMVGFLCTVQPSTPQQKVMALDVSMMMATVTGFIILTSYLLELGERVDFLLEHLSRLQRGALVQTHETLRRLSTLDALTGLPNRRQFEEEAVQACAHSPGSHVALLLIDVDHFKLYNDHLGHPAGDQCLRSLAGLIGQVGAQHQGLAARIGGEEFVLLLPGRDRDQAVQIGEALCQVVRQAALPHPVSGLITVSIGAACLRCGPSADHMGLLAEADEALYLAKAQGRNQVAVRPAT